MRLVITDTGMIWNQDNPFLKKYKDIVLVVCLEGKKVTDEYECFVSPYERGTFLGMDPYGADSRKFKALASVAGRLNTHFGCHDKIVFLTDNDPTTLYPFYATKDLIEYNSVHLVTMPPLNFEGKDRILGFREMLSDLSAVDSILYYDVNKKLTEVDKETKLHGFLDNIRDELGNMMPCFMNGIYHMRKGPCYFDFSSMEYISLKDGFESIDITKKNKIATEIDFPLEREFRTLGLICPPSYPEEGDRIKEYVERPVARLDGKKICNILRNQRLALAKANNITFESVECPSIGPCAGTCEKCDTEAAFLREEMKKIPEGERVYPHFDPSEEVTV